MTRYGIAMLSKRDGTFVFNEGVWVKEYDPDDEDETVLAFTDNPNEALSFGSHRAATDALLRISTERPVDREGHLQRPLRDVFNVEVQEIPEAA